jgi:hypothetical protein
MYKTGPFLYMDGRGKPGGKHRANVTRGRGGELTFGERSRVAVRDRTTVTPPRHPPRPLVRYTPAPSMVMRANRAFLLGLITSEANVS